MDQRPCCHCEKTNYNYMKAKFCINCGGLYCGKCAENLKNICWECRNEKNNTLVGDDSAWEEQQGSAESNKTSKSRTQGPVSYHQRPTISHADNMFDYVLYVLKFFAAIFILIKSASLGGFVGFLFGCFVCYVMYNKNFTLKTPSIVFSPKHSQVINDKSNVIVGKIDEGEYVKHKGVGLSLWSQGDKEGAVVELEKALKVKPNCVETWCKLGDCYDYLASLDYGEKGTVLRQKAVDCLNNAIKLQPTNAKAHDMLGNILWAIDFKKALVEFEVAAKYDRQFEKSVLHAKNVISECTYMLSDINTIALKSLKESPLSQIFDTPFYFDGDLAKSAVMYSCVSGTSRQWMHAWLFNSDKPDLFNEVPLGQVAISSTGDESVSIGCPPNYRAVIEKLNKEDLL